MLERVHLDERCTVTDPRRAGNERRYRDESAKDPNGKAFSETEPCHSPSPQKSSNQPCPMLEAMKRNLDNSAQIPAYFPQAGDNLPAEPEGPMEPIGPWASGRVTYNHVAGMTGLRPVVDRYSVTRHSPAEWRAHNLTFFNQSGARIADARSLANKARERNASIYRETDKNQSENRDRLSQRAGVVYGWKIELERALVEITDEIELLEGERRRVKQSLSVLTTPESIAGEFLQLRSTRLEPDLVRDPVEDELVKEVALCSEVRDTLVRTREKIEVELLELKTAKARMEFDFTDKKDAYGIEAECVGLTNDSPVIMLKAGATRVPSEQSTPAGYDRFTKEALEAGDMVRKRSVDLRSTLDAIYSKSLRDLRNQAIRVDTALAEKIHITEEVCQQLEAELIKCLSELSRTEELIEELRGSAKRVNDALKVAQTRLDNRLLRPNVESCRDVPQYGLIEEVKVLGENLSTMARQLREAENAQAGLVKARSDLEREISTQLATEKMPEPTSCRELQLVKAGSPPRRVECTDRVPPVEKPLEQKCEEPSSRNYRTALRESPSCPAHAQELPVEARICPEYRSEPTSGHGNAERQEPNPQTLAKRGPQESQICPAHTPELPVEARICPEYRSKPTSGHGNAEPQEPHPQNSAKRGHQSELPVEARVCPEYRSEPASGDGDAKPAGALREFRDLRPAPLGPIPLSGDHSTSQQYWAPLADLTGSRPAVEHLSTTRYSPAEWRLRNDRVLKESHKSVRDEMLVAFNAHRCMERIFAQTDKDQQNNNIRLSTRLGLVRRWKMEFQRQIAEFNNELDALQEEKKRLMRSKHSVNLIESIDKDVKSVRCLRMETELVRDEVEDELSNELDLCADVNNVYTRCVDQVQTQLKELKDAKQRLEIDLTDKKEAWSIDLACRALNSTSPTLEWKSGSAKMPGDQSTPTSYEHYCQEALMMAETALQRSRILRSNLNDIHEKSVHDLRAQADRVEIALSKKIDETVEACRRIENELHQCLKALSDAEALVDETRAATKRLDGAMKCAQTRLDLRSHRNKVEDCRDVPHIGLVDEVKTLSEGVSAMLSQIKRATDSIDDLTKARKGLEKDLVVKRKSLWVDRERCQLLRSFYPTVQALAGH